MINVTNAGGAQIPEIQKTKIAKRRRGKTWGKMGLFSLEISDKERAYLEAVSAQKGVSMARILIQGLRLYQEIDERIKCGKKIFTENDKKERVSLEFLL